MRALDCSFALITEGTASQLSTTLLEAISHEMSDLEHALTLRRRLTAKDHPPLTEVVRDDSGTGNVIDADIAGFAVSGAVDSLESLEAAIGVREALVIEMLRLLCKAQVEAAHAHPILQLCTRVFKHQINLFKWLPAIPALCASPPSLPKRYEKIVEALCGEESLCSAMYNMIAFVGACDQNTKTAARAKREAKLIPELVYHVDKFEAEAVKISAKSKVDLLRLMKRATARDFRIQVSEVATKLKMNEATRRKEERDKREKESKKRKRAADKADKAKGGGKAPKSVAGAAGKSGGKKAKFAAPEPVAEDEDDEGEEDDEGDDEEEDADEYPNSMIDDDEEMEDEP